jgi:Tfp pilus assembly protein PilZ
MKKNFSNVKTPVTSQEWRKKSEESRINIISEELKKNSLYKDFEVIKAADDGQIILKIERIIPANQRGLLLLELEEKLKLIDEGITIWCEPVGDKSKLRKLRGVEIRT